MTEQNTEPPFDSRTEYFQPFRHMVRYDHGGWRCVDCEQWFQEWPPDSEPCPGDEGHREDVAPSVPTSTYEGANPKTPRHGPIVVYVFPDGSAHLFNRGHKLEQRDAWIAARDAWIAARDAIVAEVDRMAP